MSSLFGTNLRAREKSAEKRGGDMTSTRHEPVSHATRRGLAASLSQTSARWSGLFWACPVESQKQTGFLARVERDQHDVEPLSRLACMLALRLLKGGALIAAMMQPHGKDDPDPHIGQRPDSHCMAFAFSSLTLVIVPGPRLTLRGLPSKLMKRIAQGFDAPQATMRFGVHAALIQHGRGSPQRLQTAGILVAASIIPDLSQQSWSQTLAGTWQALKDLMVLMGQKKGVNLLVVLRNLLDQRQQLTHQRQHQPRFGARGDGIRLQVRLMHLLENGDRHHFRIGMLCLSEDLLDLFQRSGHRFLWSGVGLQEQQRALLVQFRKQLQGHGVIGFEAGRELIDQARLHPDQGILIAGEQFQLSNLLAVWSEAVQIGQVRTPGFGQQVGINRISLGTRGGSPTIDGARIDRIDGPAGFQQVSNQQAMSGLDDASHLLFRGEITNDLFQEGVQLAQSLRAVIDTKRTDLTALFINNQGIMMVIGPVNTDIPHQK